MTAGIATHGPAGASILCIGLVHVYRAAGTDIAALRGVDLDVRAGERVALLGPSGSGKSTLLAVVAGIRRPSAGSVIIDGADIARLPEPDLRSYRAGTVGTMLQGALFNLLPYASPIDNVRLAQRTKRRTSQPTSQATSPATSQPTSPDPQALLTAAGLTRAQQRTPVARLSSARQQFVALAVALANAPAVLAADEPTAQLDAAASRDLLEVMIGTTDEHGTTVLVVTHDDEVAATLGRTLHLREGRIGAEGRRQERLAVVGVDGSLQLPEHLAQQWPAGTLVRVQPAGAGARRILRIVSAAPEVPEERTAGPGAGLELRDLSAGAGRHPVVQHLSMRVPPGAVLVVTGPAGSGIGGVLAVLAGAGQPRHGAVLLGGRPVDPDLVGHAIGYAPADPTVVGTLTAIENVALTLLARNVQPGDAWEQSAQHLGELGLPPALQHNLTEQLSGGQRQRVALARATIGQPHLVIADDPTSELDPDTAQRVIGIIRALASRGASIVLSTTDPAVDRVATQRLVL